MTIDINELRRLAQAATSGEWYVERGNHICGRIEVTDGEEEWPPVIACTDDDETNVDFEANAAFIAAANPTAISELLDRLEVAEKERDHEKWLRERAEDYAKAVEEQREALRARIAEMEKQEPVAWLHETRRDSDVVTTAVKHVWGKSPLGRWLPTPFRSTSPPAHSPRRASPEGWKKELFCIQHAMAMNNWDWESDASNDMKRAAYAAVVRLRAAALEPKS